MTEVTMREMLEAGVHFGHQTRHWNPMMAPYIFGERNKIHIINLERSLPLYVEAVNFLGRMAANRGTILFVGTKRAGPGGGGGGGDTLRYAVRGSPLARWHADELPYRQAIDQTAKGSRGIDRSGRSRPNEQEGRKLSRQRELAKLSRSLARIRDMDGIPDILFIVDVGHEKIAVAEARRLSIPVVGVVDTNNTPDGVDYVIPGNDDAIRFH